MTKRDWLERRYRETPERPVRFSTVSDMQVEPLYTAGGRPRRRADAHRAARRVSRTRAASIRACTAAGSGRCASSPASARAEDTNARFHFLLGQGQTGLSTAFDMPTLMGYDADHPRARGEVGREGVAVSTLDDMRALFDGIDLDAGHDVDDRQLHGERAARHVPRRRRGAGRAVGPRSAARSRTTC